MVQQSVINNITKIMRRGPISDYDITQIRTGKGPGELGFSVENNVTKKVGGMVK